MPSSKTTVVLANPHPVLGSTEVFKTFNYAPAVAAGGLLFIAGQVGIRADGTVPTSVEEQIEATRSIPASSGGAVPDTACAGAVQKPIGYPSLRWSDAAA